MKYSGYLGWAVLQRDPEDNYVFVIAIFHEQIEATKFAERMKCTGFEYPVIEIANDGITVEDA